MTDCIGCGFCCRTAQCSLSVSIFAKQKICPALQYDENEDLWRCGLVTCKAPIAEKARVFLTIGEGCCAPLNTDRLEHLSAGGVFP